MGCITRYSSKFNLPVKTFSKSLLAIGLLINSPIALSNLNSLQLENYIAFPESKTALAYDKSSNEFINAGDSQGSSDTGDIGTNYRELLNLDHSVTPYTDELFGEQVGLSTGSLSFKQTDISIPGNFSLSVGITRTYAGLDSFESNTRDFGTWGLDLPHVRSNVLTKLGAMEFRGRWANGNACSGDLFDVGNFAPFLGSDMVQETGQSFWNGDNIHIPGAGSQKMLSKDGKRVTSNHWKIECIDSVDGYEGFKITTTDGTEYQLDQMRLLKGRNIKLTADNPKEEDRKDFTIYHVFMLPSVITDRFGNTVTYEWDNNSRLTKILSSDKRQITLQYYETGEFKNLIKEISAHHADKESTQGRKWSYNYKNLGNLHTFGTVIGLTKAIRPDNRYWTFTGPTLNKSLIGGHTQSSDPLASCDFINGLKVGGEFTITSPENVKSVYRYSEKSFKRANVPYQRLVLPWAGIVEDLDDPTKAFDKYSLCPLTYSLDEKIVSGAGLDTKIWRYSYQGSQGYHQGSNAIPDPLANAYYISIGIPETLHHGLERRDLKSTIVEGPDKTKIAHHFSAKFGWTENQEIFTDYFDDDGSTILKRVEKHYKPTGKRGTSFTKDDFTSDRVILPLEVTTTMHGDHGGKDTFETFYQSYNKYDAPTLLKEKFGNFEKYTKKNYRHNEAENILNQPTTVEISDTNSNYTTVSETTYYSGTDEYPDSVKQLKRFGVWQKQFDSYTSQGNPSKVSYNQRLKTSSSINRYQEYSSYYRGMPRTIKLPARKANTKIQATRIVDDFGGVTELVDFNGNKTKYRYDNLGRIRAVQPIAKTGEPSWLGTHYSWVYNAGVSNNQPQRTVKRCKLYSSLSGCSDSTYRVTTTVFDGHLRAKSVSDKDNVTNTSIHKYMSYDIYGNVTKESFPSHSRNNTTAITRTYDGLSRLKTVEHQYGGAEQYLYLSGNKIRVNDARGNTTTTQYLAYGSPSYEQALYIYSPENVNTVIKTNIFGNIKSIRQYGGIGSSADETEQRIYNAQQRLCAINRDDIGTSTFKYNNLGQVEWSAQGQNKTQSCPTSASQYKSSFTYDNLGAVETITYSDNTNRKYEYDNNGNTKKITGNGYRQNYTYNSLNLLEDETLHIDSYSFKLDYGYDKLGSPTSILYPGETKAIQYSPNGLDKLLKQLEPILLMI